MEAPGRVEFNISKNGIAVSAQVSEDYFEGTVLPVISALLAEIHTSKTVIEAMVSDVANAVPSGTKLNLSVKSIAHKLAAKGAADVIRAGAASLALVHSQPEFSWKELLAETQKATGFWTKSHSTNGTKARDSLQTSGFLVELANGNLALSPSAEQDLLSVLLGAEV